MNAQVPKVLISTIYRPPGNTIIKHMYSKHLLSIYVQYTYVSICLLLRATLLKYTTTVHPDIPAYKY